MDMEAWCKFYKNSVGGRGIKENVKLDDLLCIESIIMRIIND